MAIIAFDHATDGGSNGGAATTLSFSHTVTGTNPILFVGATDSNLGVHITGATYNGVAMTEVTGSPVQIPGNRYIHLYYLVGPATGAHNVVITADQSQFIYGVASSYTGAKQSGQPDNQGTNTASSTTSVSKAITTVADNSWIMCVARLDSGTVSAGSNTTLRVNTGDIVIGDANALTHPAGSTSQAISSNITANLAIIVASFSPAPVSATGGSFMLHFI